MPQFLILAWRNGGATISSCSPTHFFFRFNCPLRLPQNAPLFFLSSRLPMRLLAHAHLYCTLFPTEHGVAPVRPHRSLASIILLPFPFGVHQTGNWLRLPANFPFSYFRLFFFCKHSVVMLSCFHRIGRWLPSYDASYLTLFVTAPYAPHHSLPR